jgi:hypothetical protein
MNTTLSVMELHRKKLALFKRFPLNTPNNYGLPIPLSAPQRDGTESTAPSRFGRSHAGKERQKH